MPPAHESDDESTQMVALEQQHEQDSSAPPQQAQPEPIHLHLTMQRGAEACDSDSNDEVCLLQCDPRAGSALKQGSTSHKLCTGVCGRARGQPQCHSVDVVSS
jgi:hypothetical protein